MRTNEKTLTAIRVALLLLGAAVAAASCATRREGGTDSSTHWLDQCSKDADCGGLSCECGVCTKACTTPGDCSRLSSTAACAAVPGCGSTSSVCLQESSDAGTSFRSGPCPSDAREGGRCDGHLTSCWLPCAPGERSSLDSLFCDGGAWARHPGTSALLCRGADCSSGEESGKPCDGSIEQCWLPCGGTSRSQLLCENGTWTGRGSFACGRPCPSAGVNCSQSCVTACVGGFQQEMTCSEGNLVPGSARFPCEPDAGAPPVDGGSPFPGVSTSCASSADCYAADRACCPLCGNDPTVADKRGIALASISAYNGALCATAGACAPCVPPSGTIESFCKAGSCYVEDLGQYKTCTRDHECVLLPKDCCACGILPVSAFVAVSIASAYDADRCGTVDCAPCRAGVHVDDASTATCNTSRGYCEIAPQR